MVLSAIDANTLTTNTIVVQDDRSLQTEVDLTERAISSASALKKYKLNYNAEIIGNPVDDPNDDTNLTALQIRYRDTFIGAGYLVTLDSDTGLWHISWATQAVETLVSVYSVRTTVTPGAISSNTIDSINTFFDDQIPVGYSNTVLVGLGNGGDIQESDFGGTDSVFYEYISIVQQQNNTDDLSNDLLLRLTATSLGYSTINTAVYKLV